MVLFAFCGLHVTRLLRTLAQFQTMTTYKRTKTTEEAATASLVTQVYDCMMQTSRKQLAQLLALLVKGSSESLLERVRDEARRCGALVPVTSRWQTCSDSQLDLFFSGLVTPDLGRAARVCGRWRRACDDSGAGWRQWLTCHGHSRHWLSAMQLHRIRPENLTRLRTLQWWFPDPDMVRHLVRLPSLTNLDLFGATPLSETDLSLLRDYRGVKTIRLRDADLLATLMAGACSKSWEDVTVDTCLIVHNARVPLSAAALPRIKRLCIPCLGRVPDLSQLPTLRELTLELFSDNPQTVNLEPLLQATQLRALRLIQPTREQDAYDVDTEFCELLGRLTWLQTLHLPRLCMEQSDALNQLASLTGLTELRMRSADHLDEEDDVIEPRTDDCLFLSALTNLTTLDGLPLSVAPDRLKLLEPLHKLRQLCLGAHWGDEGVTSSATLAPLLRLPALTELHLRDFGLSGGVRQEWKRAEMPPLPPFTFENKSTELDVASMYTVLSIQTLAHLRLQCPDPDQSMHTVDLDGSQIRAFLASQKA